MNDETKSTHLGHLEGFPLSHTGGLLLAAAREAPNDGEDGPDEDDDRHRPEADVKRDVTDKG